MNCINCKFWEFENNGYYYTCLKCGVMINNIFYDFENKKHDSEYKQIHKIIYKRVWYLKELINSINLKYFDSKFNFNYILNELKNNSINFDYFNIKLF